eukprot:3521527-Rhodomonas_salina.2
MTTTLLEHIIKAASRSSLHVSRAKRHCETDPTRSGGGEKEKERGRGERAGRSRDLSIGVQQGESALREALFQLLVRLLVTEAASQTRSHGRSVAAAEDDRT